MVKSPQNQAHDSKKSIGTKKIDWSRVTVVKKRKKQNKKQLSFCHALSPELRAALVLA